MNVPFSCFNWNCAATENHLGTQSVLPMMGAPETKEWVKGSDRIDRQGWMGVQMEIGKCIAILSTGQESKPDLEGSEGACGLEVNATGC